MHGVCRRGSSLHQYSPQQSDARLSAAELFQGWDRPGLGLQGAQGAEGVQVGPVGCCGMHVRGKCSVRPKPWNYTRYNQRYTP